MMDVLELGAGGRPAQVTISGHLLISQVPKANTGAEPWRFPLEAVESVLRVPALPRVAL